MPLIVTIGYAARAMPCHDYCFSFCHFLLSPLMAAKATCCLLISPLSLRQRHYAVAAAITPAFIEII